MTIIWPSLACKGMIHSDERATITRKHLEGWGRSLPSHSFHPRAKMRSRSRSKMTNGMEGVWQIMMAFVACIQYMYKCGRSLNPGCICWPEGPI